MEIGFGLMKIDAPRCNQNYTVASWSIAVRIKIDLWRLLDVAEAIYLAPLNLFPIWRGDPSHEWNDVLMSFDRNLNLNIFGHTC